MCRCRPRQSWDQNKALRADCQRSRCAHRSFWELQPEMTAFFIRRSYQDWSSLLAVGLIDRRFIIALLLAIRRDLRPCLCFRHNWLGSGQAGLKIFAVTTRTFSQIARGASVGRCVLILSLLYRIARWRFQVIPGI